MGQVRAVLYARVSNEEQVEGYSLDAQVRAFRSLAEARNWQNCQEYLEQGKSAHVDDVAKRPVFKEAIDDALRGKYDVLVVHKIDRFSRKLRVTLEYVEKLGRAGVGFVSILNQFDYSRPEGKFMLVMMGGLAELYSDNLGQEVKKGLQERKAQGLYNGLLPFGVTKGEDGVPIPHPDTSAGLRLIFDLASEGKSDRQVAMAVNAAGYRTAGNSGGRSFTKDSVRGVLVNRFYVGELPNGENGWIDGKHEPLVPLDTFEHVQQIRARNRSQPHTVKRTARVYSLSGVLRCTECQGPMWIHQSTKGRARIYCRDRLKKGACANRGTFLDVYEDQVAEYLRRFVIPEDYRARILAMYRGLEAEEESSEQIRGELEARLARLRKLFEWGDISEDAYVADSSEIKEELARLAPTDRNPEILDRLETFLLDVSEAWAHASADQRNRLARQLFDAVWVRNEHVVAVRPRAELRPFFQISEECQIKSLSGDPDRIRTGDLCLDRAVC